MLVQNRNSAYPNDTLDKILYHLYNKEKLKEMLYVIHGQYNCSKAS